MSACPNIKSEQWLNTVKKTSYFEAYRLFVANGFDMPPFAFKEKKDIEKYLNFLPQLSKKGDVWFIPFKNDYGKWTTNSALVHNEVKRINNIYKGLLTIKKKPTTDAIRIATGRTKIEWIELNEQALTEYYKVYEDPIEAHKEAEDKGEMYYEQRVAYNLKVTGALMDIKDIRKTIRINDKANPYRELNLRKLLRGKGINDQQIGFIFDYMKENDISAMNTEDLAIKLASEFAYTVESNVQKNKDISIEHPTQYYANLTVPGGTNYTENEIKTPDITPSIKGHAQFATAQGIGWFRSDDEISTTGAFEGTETYQFNGWVYEDLNDGTYRKYTTSLENFTDITKAEYLQNKPKAKTRRVLELQSDLFQKGRTQEDLVTAGLDFDITEDLFIKEGKYYFFDRYAGMAGDPNDTHEISKEKYEELLKGKKETPQNKFLQLLNKDSNWVTFFINTIIQDSAKRGYEEVLFPKGKTAAKVEGHQTISEQIEIVNRNIKNADSNIDYIKKHRSDYTTDVQFNRAIEGHLSLKQQAKKQRYELKSQGIEKLKPIEAFYEIKVGNILKKIDPNIQTITDEYGNQWYEYTVKEDDLSKGFALQRGESILSPENRIDFEEKKAIMLKTFPRVTEVIEDYNMPQAGILEANGTVIKVNPTKWTTDTVGHEFGHLLIDVIGGLDNPLVKKARKQLIDSNIERRIKENYPDLVEANDGRIDKEIVAQAIGEQTSKIFTEEKDRAIWRNILTRILDRIKKFLHIDHNASKELARKVLSGESINKETSINIPIYESRATEKLIAELTPVSEKPTDIQKLREKAIESLQKKFKIYRKRDFTNKIDKVKQTIDEIEKLDNDPIHSLKIFQDFATKQTQDVFDRFSSGLRKHNKYLRGEEGGKSFSLRDLARWKDYVTGFSMLSELAKIAESAEVDTETTSRIEDILDKSKLSEAIRQRDAIEDAYVEYGTELVAKFLAPHSKHIEASFRETLEKEYNKLSKEEKSLKSKEKYLREHLGEDSDSILHLSENLIKEELTKATKDINQLQKWMDNVLDSPDAVVSAMATAFAEADFKARQEYHTVQDEMVDKVRDLEKYYSDKTGITKNIKGIYDFMLEKDRKGNYTQNIVTAYRSSLWDDYNTFKKKLEDKGTSHDLVEESMKWWKKTYMPLNHKLFTKAKDEFLNDLVKKGIITKKEKLAVDYNAQWDNSNRKELSELISEEAASTIHEWLRDNVQKYREPTNWFRNPQWLELLKIAGGTESMPLSKQIKTVEANKNKDPRLAFYNFIVKQNEKIQAGVPYTHRLKTRLPSVIKDTSERAQSGQGASKVIRHSLERGFNVLADEDERGSGVLTDEAGNVTHFIPVYYATDIREVYKAEYNNLKPSEQEKISVDDYVIQKSEENQSYDLGTIYSKYYNSAINYKHKQAILPEMEMARFLVSDRSTIQRDGKGNIVRNILQKEQLVKTENLSKQLNYWFEALMYGIKEKDEGTLFGGRVDVGKAADLLNKYTALNLLGLNFITGTANVILGSSMQTIEAAGGKHYSIKDMAKANTIYGKNLPGMMGDIGTRKPTNRISLLLRKFDVLNEYQGTTFEKDTKFRQLLTTNTLFFTSHAGEHFMQTKVLLAMLNKLQAVDANGNDLGPMMEQYSVVKGKLTLNDKVANFSIEDQALFEAKVRRVLSSLHGEYTQAGRVAVQRYALGRMAYMFRKFVIPGFRRRYQKRQVNNGLGEYVEGNYRTTGRFLKNFLKEHQAWQLTLMATDWQSLTDMERSNIRKTIVEASFLIAATILANVFISMKEDSDDGEEWIWSFLSYQALRHKTELWFFINPMEAMKILRSPAASMSVIENSIRLIGQLMPPDFAGFERYERGSWKGRPKIEKTAINFVPGMKQIYRMRNVSDQITWLKN